MAEKEIVIVTEEDFIEQLIGKSTTPTASTNSDETDSEEYDPRLDEHDEIRPEPEHILAWAAL